MTTARLCVALLVAPLLFLIPSQANAANCYIREYQGLGGAQIPIAQEPGTDQAPISLAGGAVSSSAFAATTHVIRIVCGASASFLVGTSPTATTSNSPIPALLPEYFGVTPGQVVSIVSNASP